MGGTAVKKMAQNKNHRSIVSHATPAGATGLGNPLHSENIQIISISPLPFGTLTHVSPSTLEVDTVIIQ
jgi:hypothetical protein